MWAVTCRMQAQWGGQAAAKLPYSPLNVSNHRNHIPAPLGMKGEQHVCLHDSFRLLLH